MSVDRSTIDLDLLTGNEKIVAEAKDRFHQCETWESNFHRNFLEDLKFSVADSINGWQWPNSLRKNRDIDERPVLTVNKTHQHCLLIINDSKKNKPSIRIRATGNGASYQSAEILEGVVRRIEYQSNAQVAYDKATEFQVFAGIGYWRVITDYASPDSFDQEIFIRRLKDPLNVYLDNNINEVDGSDARFAFIFDDMPREEFKRKYPKHKDIAGQDALGNSDGWLAEDHVRVAEYYRAVDKKRTLVAFMDPASKQPVTVFKDEIPKELIDIVLQDEQTMTREVQDVTIEWYLIAGTEIIDQSIWPGKYIPVVRLIGEETIVDGQLDRKGHTRYLKDPQRIYNYWSSSAVEQVALQAKLPYKATAKAIEGYETYWETANRINYAVLPYNHVDDDGNPLPAPEREQPPQMAQAYIQGLQISSNEMMMVSGQYQAMMGQASNETSGKAINERQRQGETANYHFLDNLAISVRFTGKILIDLIPKIYDTKRVMRIMAEDGTQSDITLDPKAAAAYAQQQNRLTQNIDHVFNPNVGKYEVQSDVGPNYGTRRQEAFNAFTQIAAQNPELMSIIGDLMFKNADFPGADKIADRLAHMVPAQALGNAAPPEVQQLQVELQNLQKVSTNLMDELAIARLKVQQKDAQSANKDSQKEIDEYKALTDRLKVLLPSMINPKDIAQNIFNLMTLEKQNSHALSMADDDREHQVNMAESDQEHQMSMLKAQPAPSVSSGGS